MSSYLDNSCSIDCCSCFAWLDEHVRPNTESDLFYFVSFFLLLLIFVKYLVWARGAFVLHAPNQTYVATKTCGFQSVFNVAFISTARLWSTVIATALMVSSLSRKIQWLLIIILCPQTLSWLSTIHKSRHTEHQMKTAVFYFLQIFHLHNYKPELNNT